jgi:hypothetical protein
VYPVVVMARRGVTPSYRVVAWSDPSQGVALPAAVLREQLEGLMPLPPASPGGRSLLARSLAGAPFEPLGRRVDVRWCVSFHKRGLRDEFVFEQRPSPAIDPRPFLGGGRWQGNREVEPYRIAWAGWWIDYDRARARAAGNSLPPPEVHEAPKVVLCQNARRGRAALDRDGLVLKDTFLSLRCRHEQDLADGWLEWLVLVLNSELLHFLYEHLYGGTRKGGGYLHFLSRYVAPLPLPPPLDVDRVRAVHAALCAGDGDPRDAEALVRAAWRVTPEEARALDVYDYPDS